MAVTWTYIQSGVSLISKRLLPVGSAERVDFNGMKIPIHLLSEELKMDMGWLTAFHLPERMHAVGREPGRRVHEATPRD